MKSALPKDAYKHNARIYSLLSHPKRLEILNTLKVQDASLEQLTDVIKSSKANVSQHLALLRHAQLVSVRRRGKEAVYSIIDKRIVEPCKILYDLWKKK